MELLRGSRTERIDRLITVGIVLGILLIILAAWAVLSGVLGFLGRFRQEIFMFIFGALIAYLLIPLVDLLQRVVRMRWAAVLASYLLLFLALVVFGLLLLNPFISQARSLADNLHNPARASLKSLREARTSARSIQTALQSQQQTVSGGQPISAARQQTTTKQMEALQRQLTSIASDQPVAGQAQIPPSYVTPIQVPVQAMIAAYKQATSSPSAIEPVALSRALAEAKRAATAADTSFHEAAATPVLLLNAQTWLDEHGVQVNLQSKFGSALQQLSKEASSILNNALGIALRAGNLLLNTVLILIISVYFVSDGGRFVNWCIRLAPMDARPRVRFFVSSLDKILGSYLRTQVLLAALAAALNTTGAVVLGIPYAIVIFFSTFLLSLIPVIGPVILPFPPMIIALIFTPLPKPIFYLVWVLVAGQLATNIIGPRVQGHSVGIHPLEAMAAALVGLPIAGFIGAFFAVPIVSFLHVVVREALRARREDVEAESPSPVELPSSGSHPLRGPP